MIRKVCIFTGARSDFGILQPFIREVMQDEALEMQLIVTGSHLSAAYGMTVDEIEKAEIPIARRVEILGEADTRLEVAKAVGRGVIGFSEALSELTPDVAVVLGDRYEALAAAFSAVVLGIPVVHFHGGEVTQGSIDDRFRHAITKLASLHFVAAEPYRKRVIQMGDGPDRVFVVGGLGVDAMLRMPLLSREEVEHRLNFQIDGRTLVATVHSATGDTNGDPAHECREMLAALEDQRETRIIFTFANADAGGKIVNEQIVEFVKRNVERSVCFPSLGSQLYFSCLKHVAGLIGNSSSGLLEAPSFHVGTINIGPRQDGRLRSVSVIDCPADRNAIAQALSRLFSAEFRTIVASASNPYGSGGAAAKILKILKSFSSDQLHTSSFHDLSA